MSDIDIELVPIPDVTVDPQVDATHSCGASFVGPASQVRRLLKDHACQSMMTHFVTILVIAIVTVLVVLAWFTWPADWS